MRMFGAPSDRAMSLATVLMLETLVPGASSMEYSVIVGPASMPVTSPSMPYICSVSSRSAAWSRTSSSILLPYPCSGLSSKSSEGKMYPSKLSGLGMSSSLAVLPPLATRTGNFAIFFFNSASDSFGRSSSTSSSSSYSSSSYSSSGYSSSSHSSSHTSSSYSTSFARFGFSVASDNILMLVGRSDNEPLNNETMRRGIANAMRSAATTRPIENAANMMMNAPNALKWSVS